MSDKKKEDINKKGQKMQIITLRVPEVLKQKVDTYLETKDIHLSRNMYILQLIEKDIKKQKIE